MRFLGWGIGHLNPPDFPHEANALIPTEQDRLLAAVAPSPVSASCGQVGQHGEVGGEEDEDDLDDELEDWEDGEGDDNELECEEVLAFEY